MKIEVLGTGCAKCNELYNRVLDAVGKSGKFAQVQKVEDVVKIMEYGVMSTPALVIGGEIKCSGKVPTVDEIMEYLS